LYTIENERAMDFDLENKLVFLLEQNGPSRINPLARQIMRRAELMNLFTFTVLKRSVSLVHGFALLIRTQYFVCTAPLVRLQLDNLLRFSAAFLVDDQNQFVLDILGGKEIRQLKNRLGKKMCDSYLQDALVTSFPTIKMVYKTASGYIHLSDAHFFNAMRLNEKENVEGYTGPDDPLVENETYRDATDAMISISSSLLDMIAGWIDTQAES
jgi:hypothetical protein